MTRLFYRDPIKAFYMVREFGIIIENNAILEEQVIKAGKWEKLSRTIYPVAKESEHIFKVKKDDIINTECFDGEKFHHYNPNWICEIEEGSEKLYTKNFNVSRQWVGNSMLNHIIIMRDNKHFFTPEVEDE